MHFLICPSQFGQVEFTLRFDSFYPLIDDRYGFWVKSVQFIKTFNVDAVLSSQYLVFALEVLQMLVAVHVQLLVISSAQSVLLQIKCANLT